MFPRGQLAKEASDKDASRVAKDTLFSRKETSDAAPASRKRARSEGKAKKGGGKGGGVAVAEGDSAAPGAAAAVKRALELSVPRLRPGMALLGRIRRVTATLLTLSLPSGLTGYCRVEDTTDALAAACAGAAGAAAEEEEGGGRGLGLGLALRAAPSRCATFSTRGSTCAPWLRRWATRGAPRAACWRALPARAAPGAYGSRCAQRQ